jgi:undecaprenyl-diphosphatase
VIALVQAIILGIVEGVTEFLPISSTGHLALCQRWMGLGSANHFWRTFAIFIQIGAILAVVVCFRNRLLDLLGRPRQRPEAASPAAPGGEAVQLTPDQRKQLLVCLTVASVPALVVGYLAQGLIERHLSADSGVVPAAFLVGGLLMILMEWHRGGSRAPAPSATRIEQISLGQAIFVGLSQVLAVVFPGFSRSAATIIGGMAGGLSRGVAAEFSFLLAVPVMFAACGYSLLKFLIARPQVSAQEILLFAVGAIVSFLVAWGVIDWFMHYIRRHTFLPFAIYRIILAVVVMLAST